MKFLLLKEGLAISVGPFLFIPSHLIKSATAFGIGVVSLAYAAKELGHHQHESLLIDREMYRQYIEEGRNE